MDGDVAGLPEIAAAGLVHHDARVPQAVSLARLSAGQQQAAHAGGLADADGADGRGDVGHRVVDGEARGDGAAGGVDVEGYGLVRRVGLEEEELGDDGGGEGVVDGAGKRDDAFAEEAGEDVVCCGAREGKEGLAFDGWKVWTGERPGRMGRYAIRRPDPIHQHISSLRKITAIRLGAPSIPSTQSQTASASILSAVPSPAAVARAPLALAAASAERQSWGGAGERSAGGCGCVLATAKLKLGGRMRVRKTSIEGRVRDSSSSEDVGGGRREKERGIGCRRERKLVAPGPTC
ncbi:MAG: hypothetical protein LQ340_004860 [Diploschistes diacapsis]|nr:MAG: hypothetical protein LQ340_004860 [Diploschistes diacapsis]